jgi:hypothetical protein
MGVFIPIIRNFILVMVGITRGLIYHALTMERIDMIWLVVCNGVEDQKKVILSRKIQPSYVIGFVQNWHIPNFVCNFDAVNVD